MISKSNLIPSERNWVNFDKILKKEKEIDINL